MISIQNKPQEFEGLGVYKADSLKTIAQLLQDNQNMHVKRCSMVDVPRKLQHFPDVTENKYGYLSNGAKVWIISQDGCYKIHVLRG